MKKYTSVQKDSSIYEEFPTKTSGLDEILEVGKTNNGADAVRSLIQFDISTISQSIAAGTYPITTKFDLKLFVANANAVKRNQLIYIFPVSSSWEEGSGYYYQDLVSDVYGASWQYAESGSRWVASGSDFIQSTFTSCSMSTPMTDVTVDVTSIVRSWLSSSFTNNGFLLAFTSSDESSTLNRGNIKFFSKDTHTIYQPLLISKFDTATYLTGSMTSSSTIPNVKIQSTNLKSSYGKNESVRVDLHVRSEFPTKTFGDTLTTFASKYYLPTSSYFSIIDIQAQASLVEFDQYSKIENDGTGSYLKFDTSNLYPNRTYELRYKVDYGTSQIFAVDSKFFTIRSV